MKPPDLAHTEADFEIRPPHESEAKACRMLLPAVREAAVTLVATAGAEQRVVGAAALTKSLRPKPPFGPGVDLHVIPPWRRRGIGRSLLEQLKRSAAISPQIEALYAINKVEAGTAEEQGWRWLGFCPLETVIHHELALSALEPRLAPLHEWMLKNNWIPADAQIIALCDSDRDAVAKLHMEILGGQRDLLLRKMHGRGPQAYHPTYSRVLLVTGEIKGCILAHRESADLAVVDANILDPSVRGGWANVWLKLEATRGAARLGIERFEYSTFDHYTDTRAFSEKLGGVEKRRMLLMHYPLSAAARGVGE